MKITSDIRQAVTEAIKKLWPDLEVKVGVVTPPNPDFGDYSCAVPLQLAKLVQADPLEIAKAIREEIGKLDYVLEITVTAPGYLNFDLNYPALAESIFSTPFNYQLPTANYQNISVEHTSVNPNKAAHIGHLRNACLGDSLARILRGIGHTVEVQNYIDDLGVQVADSVVAFETFGDAPENYEIDKWLWKIYADINTKYESRPELLKRREEVLHEMEQGENETAKQIVEKIVNAQANTFLRFGINYDLLVYEHDIVNNHLWDKLFDELKDQKLIVKPDEGSHAGAWLVEFGESDREDKILVKSNGLLTYTAKDLAYALWKFGKTNEMAGYEHRLSPIQRHYNIIDERQSYPQAVIKYVMEKLGFKEEAKNYLHIGYGVVKLSAKAIKLLGYQANQATASMSGRSGIGVMVDELFETTVQQQIKQHESSREVAEKIAVGSIRYYMLKSRPEREIVFDFDDALATLGNTGVYLQYAYARANNILEKAGILNSHSSDSSEDSSFSLEPTPLSSQSSPLSSQSSPLSSRARSRDLVPDSSTTIGITEGGMVGMTEEGQAGIQFSPQEKALLKTLSELVIEVHRSVDQYDPSLLCDYAYRLASTFAKFYETSPVLGAENPAQKALRLGLVESYKLALGAVLDLLGIPVLARL